MKGLFAKFQPLKTKAWLRDIPDEDRKAFGHMGYDALGAKYGYEFASRLLHGKGGKKSSAQNARDEKGRFKVRVTE